MTYWHVVFILLSSQQLLSTENNILVPKASKPIAFLLTQAEKNPQPSIIQELMPLLEQANIKPLIHYAIKLRAFLLYNPQQEIDHLFLWLNNPHNGTIFIALTTHLEPASEQIRHIRKRDIRPTHPLGFPSIMIPEKKDTLDAYLNMNLQQTQSTIRAYHRWLNLLTIITLSSSALNIPSNWLHSVEDTIQYLEKIEKIAKQRGWCINKDNGCLIPDEG